MTLLTKAQLEQLRLNGKPENWNKDHLPVVKLFLPGTSFSWLLVNIDPGDNDVAFGLCDYGMNNPDMGTIFLYDLKTLRTLDGCKVVSYSRFEAKYPISVYTEAARFYRTITLEDRFFQQFVKTI